MRGDSLPSWSERLHAASTGGFRRGPSVGRESSGKIVIASIGHKAGTNLSLNPRAW
jgi:hypothetical protein